MRQAAVVAALSLAALGWSAPVAACSCDVLEEVVSPREGEVLAVDGAIVFLTDGQIPTLTELGGKVVPLEIDVLGPTDLWFHCAGILSLARPVGALTAGFTYELQFASAQWQVEARDVPAVAAPVLLVTWQTGDPNPVPDDGVGCSGDIPAIQYQSKVTPTSAAVLPVIVVGEVGFPCGGGYRKARLLLAEGHSLLFPYTSAAADCMQIYTYDLQGRLLSSEPACPPDDVQPAVPPPPPCPTDDAGVLESPTVDAGVFESPTDAGVQQPMIVDGGDSGEPPTDSGGSASRPVYTDTGSSAVPEPAQRRVRHAKYCFCSAPGIPSGDAPVPFGLFALGALALLRRCRASAVRG